MLGTECEGSLVGARVRPTGGKDAESSYSYQGLSPSIICNLIYTFAVAIISILPGNINLDVVAFGHTFKKAILPVIVNALHQ